MKIKVAVKEVIGRDNAFVNKELDIITQDQLDELVSNFLSADFATRKDMLLKVR